MSLDIGLILSKTKPVEWSKPLKNPLGPLNELAISASASDWPGSRHRDKEGSRTLLIVPLSVVLCVSWLSAT